MNKSKFFRSAVGIVISAGLAVLFLTSSALCADDYQIKLFRPFKVGDTTAISLSASQASHSVIKVEGIADKKVDDVLEVSLTGKREILAVDDKGNATKYACTVTKMEAKGGADAEASEVLPAGSVIIAEWDGTDTHYSLKDGELPASAMKAVKLVIKVHDPKHPTDDDSLGTHERKKVGDTWGITPEIVAKELSEYGFAGEKLVPSGESRLDEIIKTEGGVECMRVKGEFSLKNISGHLPKMPEWIKIDDGQMNATTEKLLPTDVSLGERFSTLKATISIEASGTSPDGKALKFHLELDESMTERDTPK